MLQEIFVIYNDNEINRVVRQTSKDTLHSSYHKRRKNWYFTYKMRCDRVVKGQKNPKESHVLFEWLLCERGMMLRNEKRKGIKRLIFKKSTL